MTHNVILKYSCESTQENWLLQRTEYQDLYLHPQNSLTNICICILFGLFSPVLYPSYFIVTWLYPPIYHTYTNIQICFSVHRKITLHCMNKTKSTGYVKLIYLLLFAKISAGKQPLNQCEVSFAAGHLISQDFVSWTSVEIFLSDGCVCTGVNELVSYLFLDRSFNSHLRAR